MMTPTEWLLVALAIAVLGALQTWIIVDENRALRRVFEAHASGSEAHVIRDDFLAYSLPGARLRVDKSSGAVFLTRRKLRPIRVPDFQVTDRSLGMVLFDAERRKVLFLEGATVADIMEGSSSLLSLDALERVSLRDGGRERDRGAGAGALIGGALAGPLGAAVGSLSGRDTVKGELAVELRFSGPANKPTVKSVVFRKEKTRSPSHPPRRTG